jgi:hypothetical protein
VPERPKNSGQATNSYGELFGSVFYASPVLRMARRDEVLTLSVWRPENTASPLEVREEYVNGRTIKERIIDMNVTLKKPASKAVCEPLSTQKLSLLSVLPNYLVELLKATPQSLFIIDCIWKILEERNFLSNKEEEDGTITPNYFPLDTSTVLS